MCGDSPRSRLRAAWIDSRLPPLVSTARSDSRLLLEAMASCPRDRLLFKGNILLPPPAGAGDRLRLLVAGDRLRLVVAGERLLLRGRVAASAVVAEVSLLPSELLPLLPFIFGDLKVRDDAARSRLLRFRSPLLSPSRAPFD